MRRWILYTAAAALLLLLVPIERTDVGQLQPVELLCVSLKDGAVQVETDTKDRGIGKDLTEALKDLEESACGVIFLETADYLLVTKDTRHLLPELTDLLRPATEVCLAEEADAEAADYLRTHSPDLTLNQIRAGKKQIPVLKKTGGRYRLEPGEDR